MKLHRIGLRTIKTSIAVMITAGIMHYIFHEPPFFACIGATVGIGKTKRTSFDATIVRNVGTAVGGIIGMIISLSTQNVFLKGLGVIPVIYIINIFNKKDSIVPGCIVYYAVVYLNTTETAGIYAIKRILQTFFGSIIGIIVNFLIRAPLEEDFQ
ncbi:MAG: aromatic acid exporter family protein [Andreesenia angusta]|nr:aromatic acid exporter family protein [Andreesenia angusta]